jgi:predicted Zn-dependent protease
MRTSSATKTRLLNPWSLILVAMAAGALFWFSYQKEEVYRPDGGQPDIVSANYAQLLLQRHPDNDALRIQLVELLLKLGDYKGAHQQLDDWPKPDLALQAYYRLEADTTMQAGNPDPAVHQALLARLDAVDYRHLPLPQTQRVATLALALQAPKLAAAVYRELAVRDPELSKAWLNTAAQWSLASEQPGQAADIYLQLLGTAESPEEHRHYLQQAFSGLLGADRGEEALTLLVDELQRNDALPLQADVLEQGVNLAVAQQRLDLAQQIFTRWRQQQPDDPQILEKEFKLRLAFGDLDGAWADGQQLVQMHPRDVALVEQMAHLAEWKGDTAAALGYWIALLQLRDDPAQREHAWQLAIQSYDYDRAIPLLADIMQRRALNDAELDSLIFAHESRGTPEQAQAWLRDYLRKYPKQRDVWVRLLQNLEATNQYAAKLPVYKAMAARFPLTIAERLDWASTYLKLYDMKSAWQVLEIDNRKVRDLGYWKLRADLAWKLERDDQMRQALEQMLAIHGSLDRGDETQLINLYRLHEPRKALQFLVRSWQRDHNAQRLVAALQLAQELQDWPQLSSLLDEAKGTPADDLPQVLAARGALAMQQNQPDAAEAFYRQGLTRFPGNGLFRERLLWLLVDQNRTKDLPPLLQAWHVDARRDTTLWLPFASASQMTGRLSESLAWYRLYLQANPQDWLVQAAYADALEAADYKDMAQRLRLQLTKTAPPASLKDTPQRYALWLRLIASSYSPRVAQQQALKAQDGRPAMLQLWFERMLARLDATNQEAQKNDWLAWGRANGLRIEHYEQIQEALRNINREVLRRMLAKGELDPAQQVEALNRLGRSAEAMEVGLSNLGDDQPLVIRKQLLRQTVELQERAPQGVQLGWNRIDYGGLDFAATRLTAAHNLGEHWYGSAVLEQGRYSGDRVESGRLGQERNALLTFKRQLVEGSYSLIVDSSLRDDHDRNGLGLLRSWQLTPSDELNAGLNWHRKSEETGLMRTFGQEDSLTVNGSHRFSARDQLSWGVAQKSFATRDGDDLGNSQALRLEYNHTLQFEGPNWIVRSGLDYQHNSLNGKTLDSLANSNGGAYKLSDDGTLPTAADLLQDRYGQLYVGSSWRRGFPGALNRTRAQYTWLIDTTAGWQWLDKTFNYGINTGIGVELLGNDELAVTVGYQSAPQGGSGAAGGTLGVSYALRFGR